VINPEAEKSTLRWLRVPSRRSSNARPFAHGEIMRGEFEHLVSAETPGTPVTVEPHGDALPEGVDQADGKKGREQVRPRGASVRYRCLRRDGPRRSGLRKIRRAES
jgi:hypothetical protein